MRAIAEGGMPVMRQPAQKLLGPASRPKSSPRWFPTLRSRPGEIPGGWGFAFLGGLPARQNTEGHRDERTLPRSRRGVAGIGHEPVWARTLS